jgi:uncharacterized protein YkwD
VARLSILCAAPLAAAGLYCTSPALGATQAAERYLAPRIACPGQANPSAILSEQATSLHCLVNWARGRRGLRGVRELPLLDRSALLRALEIRRCNDFSHTPCGQPFAAVFYAVGYLGLGARAAVGENLAWGQGTLGTARSTMRSWLSSPPHRANLFAPGWKDFGLSVVKANRLAGATNATIWVSQFGRRG